MQGFLAFLLPLVSILCLWGSHGTNRKRRLIGNLPTSKTKGVFIGLVELQGTAESESPVRSFLAEENCVLYSYSVTEHWSRTVTETYTDSEGKTQTRTRVESGWAPVASGGETTPFYLLDDTGVVLVRPEGAEVRPDGLFSVHCAPNDPLYYGKGPPGAVADSTFQRHFSETGIRLHSPIFAVGKARERQDVVAPELAHAKDAPLYLLTVESEAQVLSRMGFKLHLLNLLGLGCAIGFGYVLQRTTHDATPWMWICGGTYAGLWMVTWIWMVFNMLVDVRNRMRQGWSLIEVQLQRRHDLLPQLVSVVDASRHHEADVLESMAKIRTEAAAAISSRGNFHGVARTVMGIAEKYPDLKTSEAFLQLQQQIAETEQRIALARSYYNDVTTAYNTRLEVVPDGWIARLCGFVPQDMFEAGEFERAEVLVKLAE